ncbi:hypothetical protein ACFLRC_00470, partial [Candidatus Altiarchaeota archaeon]
DDSCTNTSTDDGYLHFKTVCTSGETSGGTPWVNTFWFYPDRIVNTLDSNRLGGLVRQWNPVNQKTVYWTEASGDESGNNPKAITVTRGYMVHAEDNVREVRVWNVSDTGADNVRITSGGSPRHFVFDSGSGNIGNLSVYNAMLVFDTAAASNQLGKDWETIYLNPLHDYATIGNETLL